jgi:hypothetical protein
MYKQRKGKQLVALLAQNISSYHYDHKGEAMMMFLATLSDEDYDTIIGAVNGGSTKIEFSPCERSIMREAESARTNK